MIIKLLVICIVITKYVYSFIIKYNSVKKKFTTYILLFFLFFFRYGCYIVFVHRK